MAINIKFDLAGNPEPPTILLANRNGNILGQLDVDAESIDMSDKFNDASEFSFTLYKYVDDKLTNLWDKVVDLKLVYCKEWDTWFEIKVELDEATEAIKTVFCTQLEKAELSQLNLYNIEINTESDIKRDDYKICILYDKDDADASILNRCLRDKAPHYSIAHVDSTIAKIQRSFSFDGTSIDDAFQEIAEEIGCVFIYHSYLDENRILRRTISVYDLQQNCNDCGYRGEFTDKCPKCGSINITNGYGEDTLIFITSDELANDGIELVADTDAVKNCFKLEAGDDLMTATIRNCNPNGTDYIIYISDSMKEDMSEELVDALESYNDLYKDYYDNHESDLDESLVSEYNTLVEKYKDFYNTESTCLNCDYKAIFEGDCPQCGSSNVLFGKNLQSIPTTINGYSSLMNAYYNTIDLALYLESGLMPSIEMSETSAKEQVNLLTTSTLSTVAVNTDYVEAISLATANSAVLSMAKIIVKSTYKVEIETSTLSSDKIWEGNFVITNYSDENDTAKSQTVQVVVSNDAETFIKQKIEKALNKEDTDDYSISGLFEKEYDDFCAELKKYALNPLNSFYDACDACLNILIDQGAGNQDDKPDLYEKLYEPYYKKSSAIAAEIKIREEEIAVIEGVWDKTNEDNPILITNGLQADIEKCQEEIKNALDFENYLGEKLWLEFCAYRREDTYSNDNYISDGLNNADLFKRALEFFEVAEHEIYKSAELQHSISTTLNNLLAIPKFKPLVKYFKVGNWIRVQVDGRIFKLRLLEYGIGYGSFDNISVEFSDVTKIKNGITDVQSTLKQASSMATSYSSVKRQAKQGEKSNSVLNNWVENGLNATNTKIVSAEDQNQSWGKNGMLFRQYDPITDTYGSEQLKIINSTIAITDDNWNTTKTAIGKYYYIDPITNEEKMAYGVNGETIVGKLLVGEDLIIANNNGRLEFDDNGLVVTGTKNTVIIDPNNSSTFSIKNNSDNDYILYINDKGNLVVTGDIVATNLTMADGSVVEGINVGNIDGLHRVAISGLYNDLENKPDLKAVATTGNYDDLSGTPTKLSDFDNDERFITNTTNNLTNYYNKTQVNNLVGSLVGVDSLSTVATTGSYNDLIDKPTNVSYFNNDAGYITDENLDEAIDDALAQAKENGEFNGGDGVSITHSWDGTVLNITSASGTSSADLKGEKGDAGDDGYTPVRGVDYWTDEDKTEIVNSILEELRNQGVIS